MMYTIKIFLRWCNETILNAYYMIIYYWVNAQQLICMRAEHRNKMRFVRVVHKSVWSDGKWFSISFSSRASSASAQWENTYTNTHAGKSFNLISGKFYVRHFTCFRICPQIDKCLAVLVYSKICLYRNKNTMTLMSFGILQHVYSHIHMVLNDVILPQGCEICARVIFLNISIQRELSQFKPFYYLCNAMQRHLKLLNWS